MYGHIDDHLKSILSYALDENLDFVHVGNLYDRARFSTHILCLHTNVMFTLAEHVGNLNLGPVINSCMVIMHTLFPNNNNYSINDPQF